MSITVSTHARLSVAASLPFQNIREVKAKHGSGYQKGSTHRETLRHSFLRCQTGMKDRPALDCLSCPRFVNFVPRSNSTLVRCLWTERDRVEDLMTLESALVSVDPFTSIDEADAIAQENEIRHLLVVENKRLIGVVCRCDLLEAAIPFETVANRANHCPWTIGPRTSLAQAAMLMKEKEVGMLPVVDQRNVIGVVTRGDLRRAGVDEITLGGTSCDSCRSSSGVMVHPVLQNVNICRDCLEGSRESVEYAELGR